MYQKYIKNCVSFLYPTFFLNFYCNVRVTSWYIFYICTLLTTKHFYKVRSSNVMLSRTIYTYIVNYIQHLLQFEITIAPEIKQCHAVTYSFCTLSTVFTFT